MRERVVDYNKRYSYTNKKRGTELSLGSYINNELSVKKLIYVRNYLLTCKDNYHE